MIRVLSFSFCVPCSVLQFQAVSSVGWTWNHWACWPTQAFPTPRSPRDPQSFQLTRCRCQSRLCRSCTGRIPKRSERAATTWSDSNKSTVQSFEGHGKAEICREDTHGSHVSLRCFLEKNQFRNPPKTLDSLDSLDRKLALSYCQGFCFWGSMWWAVWISQSSAS